VVVVFPSPLRPLPSTLSPYTTLFRSSAGAIDDATAWCVLAVVLASFGASASIAVTAIVGGIVFAAFMIFVMRRLLIPLGRRAERSEEHTSELQSRENLVCRLLLERKK